ncbi:GAF and ANTAR domain-containing protein [Nocardia asteroides]|uniref:GAF and ANTAR domain-containing protein n=1 Tax=Nocardia asteroides TaxID=1824 RepID=UPI001E4B42C1|nr:GAF and ANTAR domain-containing protein [Nocardia asteroides]UGT61599.1 GAF and ANTAR domain-containing protein [Nocardia asteroides]
MSPEDPNRRSGVDAGPAAEQIAAVFARMSGLFLTADTVETAQSMITALAAEMVPHAAGAGISLLDPGGERISAAATDEVVRRADAIQYELGSGPCLTAWADRVVIRIDDLTTDERWPVWSRSAAELGLRSSLSAPLVTGSSALGAIKIYATEPFAYGPREEHIATMFAAQAAMLLAHRAAATNAERVSAYVADSLRSRELVALAKGIVMARDGVDEQAAFLILANSAQRQRMTVLQVAERLAASTARRRR